MDENDLQELRKRVERCERSLDRIKFLLICVGVLILCWWIPPLGAILGLGLVGALILSILVGFMYLVYRICDRLFGDSLLDRLG